MSSIKVKNILPKKDLQEFVNSDGGIIDGGDRNVSNNSEIETGPVQKPWNDDSDYEKNVATTTDRAARYRQNIPWFAVYTYGGSTGRGTPINEKTRVLKKSEIEEDLVKKNNKDNEVLSKDYDSKTEKVLDVINDVDLTANQLEKIKNAVLSKLNKNG